jgi:hypothetical protein
MGLLTAWLPDVGRRAGAREPMPRGGADGDRGQSARSSGDATLPGPPPGLE